MSVSKMGPISVTQLILAYTFLLHIPHTQAKSLWSRTPASSSNVIQTAYPIGNGRLGVMLSGLAGAEVLTINVDSLWSGGPFETSIYAGGNPTEPAAPSLPGIRDWIFTNGTGNVTTLMGDGQFYGSYRVLGNLSIVFPSIRDELNSMTKNYKRSLNLVNGIHRAEFAVNEVDYQTDAYCSYPDQVCVYTVNSTSTLPLFELSLQNDLAERNLQNSTCTEGQMQLRGTTQAGPPEGMRYHSIARLHADSLVSSECTNEKLIIMPQDGTRSVAVVFAAGTNYDWNKGNSQDNYTFRGEDPSELVESQVQTAVAKPISALRRRHIEDFEALTSRFELSIPDLLNSSSIETALAIARYNSSDTIGDPYIESLLFDYGNYLFISSSRSGSLPPNLQGRWSEGLGAAWSADYHANINLQMNHWTPDQTGLTALQSPLWDYMEKTWVPRGTETAKLLYGAPGWVVHNEMNIFGYTGMKGDGDVSNAIWADYPIAAAWMMQHVWDHWEYSQDLEWLKSQGYGLIKGVVQFWLSQLQEDSYSKDGTLVVSPCTSPEHGPTTFGCTHYQQLIHQVFEAVLVAGSIVSEQDTSFLKNVSGSLLRLDKGLHIGAWGQVKEWKLPDSFGYEVENDTHRHLSELVGWFPGYALSSFLGGYSNSTIQSAVRQKLQSRGAGNGADANAGWAKVWRAACWARLNDTEHAHFELRYAIEQNFVANGYSMYSGENTPFQIDANFGLGGAVLSMLIVDMPATFNSNDTKTVVLGPAIPTSWGGGFVKGMKLRGGGSVDFSWDKNGLVNKALVTGRKSPLKVMDKNSNVLSEIS